MTIRETLGRYRLDVVAHGTVRFDVQPTNGRHRHGASELCLVLSGRGRYAHGDGEYPLVAGDLFVADPGVAHEISSHATRDLELWFLTLDARALDDGPMSPEDAVVGRYLARHRTHVPGAGALARYLPLVDDRAEGIARAGATAAVRYLALGMLEALAGVEPPERADAASPDPVDAALDYIDARLDRSPSVAEIAAAAGVSERTLRRRFAARRGAGVAEEANHRRMRRAAHLLLMGFSAAEAGRRVGIDAPAAFSRAFRRALGVAPKAFQQAHLTDAPGLTTRP